VSGRIRSLKPEILDDERTAGLSDPAWRLYVSMLLLADDPGNLRSDGRLLISEIWWARPDRDLIDIRALLAELEAKDGKPGLITIYRVRGQSYAAINGWSKHQKIDKPGKPRVPGPTEADGGERTPSDVPHTRRATDVRPTVCDGFASDQGSPTSTRTEDRGPQGPAPSRAPGPFGMFLDAFKAAWERRYGEEYFPTPGELSQLGRWLKTVPADATAALPVCIERYLADETPFVLEKRHSLLWFVTGDGGGPLRYRVVKGPTRTAKESRTAAAVARFVNGGGE